MLVGPLGLRERLLSSKAFFGWYFSELSLMLGAPENSQNIMLHLWPGIALYLASDKNTFGVFFFVVAA